MSSKYNACSCGCGIFINKSWNLYLHYAHLDDWKCDQYRWLQNGTKKIPSTHPALRKVYYIAVTAEGNTCTNKFKRLAYTLIDGDHRHLTLGDHTVAASSLPHSNSKVHVPTRSFVRTCLSVLCNIARNHDMPSTAYKKEIANSSCHDQHQPVLKPRNTKQVANIQW